MGGFNPPVPQQDNNLEIRVAVLLSLLFQVLILFLGPLRKRSSSPVVRFAIWSSYLLPDWVADLALGLLLNNMGNIGGNSSQPSTLDCTNNSSSSSPIIFAFWTPFLLVHLGGQDSLTALSIQDNDLWLRNLTSLGFQLFTACVIFFCSLQGNPMVPATVLIFVVGIIKYGERIYSLYSSSVDGALADIIGVPDPGPNYEKFMNLYSSKEEAGLPVELIIVDIQAQREQLRGSMMQEMNVSMETLAYKFFCIFRQLCFDIKPSYKERMISQEYFLRHADVQESPARAFEVIELELNFMYDMVHTKEPIAHSKAGCIIRFVASVCLVSSFLIFFFHGDKGSITHVDIAITYGLLLGGMAIDAAALAMLLISNWTMVFLEKTQWLRWLARLARSLRPWQQRWKNDTSQMNLISYCLGTPQPSGRLRFCSSWRVVRTLAMVAEKLHVGEIFHDLLFIRRELLSSSAGQGQSDFLFKFIFDAAKKTTNMDKMSLYRGEGVFQDLQAPIMETLKKTPWEEEDEVINNEAEKWFNVLIGSVRREFAESLLMWHIATDLCCHPLGPIVMTKDMSNKQLIGMTLSEYMLYLLIKQPKILLASAGIGLKHYQDTCAEAKWFFQTAAAWYPYHNDARRMLLSVNTTTDPAAVKGDRSKSVPFDGVILGKVLRHLGPDLMWEVVAGVWGEMLTYAAGKCSGSTHMQQLSRGGELITVVWFLMAHMDRSGKQKNELASKLIVGK